MQKVILLLVAASALISYTTAAWNYKFPVDNIPQADLDYEQAMVKRNRLCLLNAGLSQGCDLSDIIMAKQQASKFMSFAGPGRK